MIQIKHKQKDKILISSIQAPSEDIGPQAMKYLFSHSNISDWVRLKINKSFISDKIWDCI